MIRHKYFSSKLSLLKYFFAVICTPLLKISVKISKPKTNLKGKLILSSNRASLGDNAVYFHYGYILAKSQNKKLYAIIPKEDIVINFAKIFLNEEYEVFNHWIYKLLLSLKKGKTIINSILSEILKDKYSCLRIYNHAYSVKKDPLVEEIPTLELKRTYIKLQNSSTFYYGHKKYFELLKKKNIEISVNKQEVRELLSKLNITKKYICFNAKHIPKTSNMRTVDKIESYFPTFDYLIGLGYQIVILGKEPFVHPISYIKKDMINYPYSGLQSIKNDILLSSECEFFIGCASGPLLYPVFFNKPILQVNMALLFSNITYSKFRFLCKKVFFKGKRLNMYDLLRSPVYFLLEDDEDIKKMGYSYDDNDKEEILLATKEFLPLIANNDWLNYTQEQIKFRKQVKPWHMGLYQMQGVPFDFSILQ